MASSISLLFFVVAFCCVLFASAGNADSERKEIVKSAIAQAKKEFSTMKHSKLGKTQARLRSFKASTKETRAQGLATAKFERMVGLAERKILERQRQAKAQTTESLAEALAMELLHTPGSILTKDEVKLMFEESDCIETLRTPTNCNEPLPQKHRLPDGTCNNLENPTWGAAATKMRRLIAARYDDGWSRTRGFLQSQGAFDLMPFRPPRPSPRISSLGIVEDRDDEDATHTHILMQWGQFMDHDLSLMPEFEVDCPEDCVIGSDLEGVCASFPVPGDDDEVMVTRTDPGSIGCHSFHRSLPACQEEADILPREQVNAITPFIDGSMVYHHNADVQRNLIRDTSNDQGMLRTGPPSSAEPGRPLLPNADPHDEVVLCPPGAEPCFLAGDARVNEQASLTSMHTIWMREHNRVAQFIRANNPGLSGDKVFLTAQDIVISEIQKITYKDYLPIVLGPSITDLIPKYEGYDPTVRPTVANAFSTAAYRYGHSQIQPFFDLLDENFQPMQPLTLVQAFFNTSHVRTEGMDPLVRGLTVRNARLVDEFLNKILTNRLFSNDENTPGLDLASLNIQRGRDHGLPSYLIYKQWAKLKCGVESEFRNELTEIRLLQVYGSLDSVDLFVGGLAEKPLPGGLVGAVFACIFADTFRSVRDGDRFYYENPDFFTTAQRAEIEKASLSRVLCDNTGIGSVQENAFMAGEPRRSCSSSSIPRMDLSAFNIPGSGSTTLPDVCYARVSSSSTMLYRSVSRRTTAENFYVAAGRLRRRQTGCFAFLCPRENGVSRLAFISEDARCRYVPNANLDRSESSYKHVYFDTDLNSQDMSAASGFYTSSESCQRGSVNALDYTCTFETTSEEKVAEIENESTTLTEEELRNLLGDEGEEIANHGGAQSSSSAADTKLATLMSDLLEQLKVKTNSHEAPSTQEDKKPNDQVLVSELEKILEKV